MNILRCALTVVVFYLCTSVSAFAISPLAGHWWNPNESGTGYNLDLFNGVLVVTIFSYKSNGDSEWYLAAGPMDANGQHFTATLDKYRNGQCISCSYHAPAASGNDGRISITFQSETSAVVSLPNGRVTNIELLFPTTNDSLQGTYRLTRTTVNYVGGVVVDTAAGNVAASGSMTLSGSFLSQTLAVTLNGTTVSISLSGSYTDQGAYMSVTQNGVPSRITLITRRGPFLATLATFPGSANAPAFAEVDQWELVSRNGSASDKDANSGNQAVGAAIGAALASMGVNR